MSEAIFEIKRASSESVSGVVNAYSYAGMGMQYDPDDPANLEQATNTRGFQLVRNVIDSDMIDRLDLQTFPGRELFRPEPKGAVCSARKVREAWVEGEELLTLTGTGDMSSSTAGEELGYNAGKLRVKQSGDELVGYVRATDHSNAVGDGNTKRFLIEFPD